MVRPIKTIHDKRLAYLMGLEVSYKGMGYQTRVNGFSNILEVYESGVEVPEIKQELVIKNW